MTFNVNEFAAHLQFGGARSSLFEVRVSNPVNAAGDTIFPFMCRATQIPGLTVAPIPVYYFGRQIKLAGNRTYDSWPTEIYNDEDFRIRNALEQWNNAINSFEGNVRAFDSASPAAYRSTAEITQFSKTGAPLRTYKMINAWPAIVQPIDMTWEAEGIQTFQVTWEFDWWEISGGITGNAGGN